MNRNYKRLALAGTMLAASTSALADLTQVQVNTAQGTASIAAAVQGSSAFSSLLFVAYNPDNSFSIVQSLGTRGGSATALVGSNALNFGIANTDEPGLSLTFNVNGAGSLLAANAATLVWGIYSYDISGDPTVTSATPAYRFASTVASGTPAAGEITRGTLTALGTGLENFLTLNATPLAFVAATTIGTDDNWTTLTDATLIGPNTISVGSATSSLAMYLFSSVDSPSNTPNTPTTQAIYAGTWSLNAANGTLSYSNTVVPLPAAAWLLLTGLGGLGVVGRRRAIAAAA